jgi:hypothetical protein
MFEEDDTIRVTLRLEVSIEERRTRAYCRDEGVTLFRRAAVGRRCCGSRDASTSGSRPERG